MSTEHLLGNKPVVYYESNAENYDVVFGAHSFKQYAPHLHEYFDISYDNGESMIGKQFYAAAATNVVM